MPKHILLVNIGYHPFVGGAQTYAQQLAESLVRDGNQVTVFTTNAGEVEAVWDARKRRLAASDECINGVTVRRFPLRHVPPSPWGYFLIRRLTVLIAQLPGAPEALLWRLAGRAPWMDGLDEALRQSRGKFDLVHGFAIPFESLLRPAAAYAREAGVPFLLAPFLHIGEADDPTVARGYAMPHQLSLLRQADAVVALSEIERDFLVRQGVRPDRVVAIAGGIPFNEQDDEQDDAREQDDAGPTKTDRPLVLFLGAVTYDKGATHVVEAVRSLWTEGVAVDIAVAGTVTTPFRAYFDRLPPQDRARVQVLGNISEDQKQSLLRQCTLLAMPSRVDSFGLVYLEAWRYQKPVIGARAGGVPAVIDDGENGLLVSFGNAGALKTAVARLLKDAGLAQRLGQAGYEKLKARYTWDRVYQQIAQLYERVLAQ